MHSYQDQFIQPGWAKCVFCVFSLGLYFVYLFVFLLFVYVSTSLKVFSASVTNLNEPPRAFAAFNMAWVRS